jgi:hypothetical protein
MTPLSDVRGSAYERELLRIYLRRAVHQAFDANGGLGEEGAAD